MIIKKLSLDRRTLLRGLGASVALPLMDAMEPALARAAGWCLVIHPRHFKPLWRKSNAFPRLSEVHATSPPATHFRSPPARGVL